MATFIVLAITHVAAFVAGALVFRNNSGKIADAISKATDEVKKVENVVGEAKDEFNKVKSKLK
jgi:hypothetical protein